MSVLPLLDRKQDPWGNAVRNGGRTGWNFDPEGFTLTPDHQLPSDGIDRWRPIMTSIMRLTITETVVRAGFPKSSAFNSPAHPAFGGREVFRDMLPLLQSHSLDPECSFVVSKRQFDCHVSRKFIMPYFQLLERFGPQHAAPLGTGNVKTICTCSHFLRQVGRISDFHKICIARRKGQLPKEVIDASHIEPESQ
jgi:hypothetical protein